MTVVVVSVPLELSPDSWRVSVDEEEEALRSAHISDVQQMSSNIRRKRGKQRQRQGTNCRRRRTKTQKKKERKKWERKGKKNKKNKTIQKQKITEESVKSYLEK